MDGIGYIQKVLLADHVHSSQITFGFEVSLDPPSTWSAFHEVKFAGKISLHRCA